MFGIEINTKSQPRNGKHTTKSCIKETEAAQQQAEPKMCPISTDCGDKQPPKLFTFFKGGEKKTRQFWQLE